MRMLLAKIKAKLITVKGDCLSYLSSQLVLCKKIYSSKIVQYIIRLIEEILVCGVLMNVAVGICPELKEKIPYIYGFFDGMLQGLNYIFMLVWQLVQFVGHVGQIALQHLQNL